MRDPCHGIETCHYWLRHDDRCERVTEPHSTMCATHHDDDDLRWWDTHPIEDCCDAHCPGEEAHDEHEH